jgi:hypothetical protein
MSLRSIWDANVWLHIGKVRRAASSAQSAVFEVPDSVRNGAPEEIRTPDPLGVAEKQTELKFPGSDNKCPRTVAFANCEQSVTGRNAEPLAGMPQRKKRYCNSSRPKTRLRPTHPESKQVSGDELSPRRRAQAR